MKRFLILTISASMILVACHKKAIPTVTERTTPTPTETKTTTAVNIAAGKSTYEVACKKCHDLPSPTAITGAKWDGILKSMIPKAKLDATQAANVTAYVMANAKP